MHQKNDERENWLQNAVEYTNGFPHEDTLLSLNDRKQRFKDPYISCKPPKPFHWNETTLLPPIEKYTHQAKLINVID